MPLGWEAAWGPLQRYAWSLEKGARLVPTRWLKNRAVTVGSLIFIPESWPEAYAREVIPHECRHVWQYRRLGLGLAWLGVIPFLLCYLLPLPLGLAWGRFKLELDAEAWSWGCVFEPGRREAIGVRARAFAEALSSWRYGWAWPRKWVEKAFAREVDRATS